ncbi:S8 family peptidase [Thioalkalivibrio sulfidiphilus]|uniref:S8 family peptidase n=1 Tax=Thioalkalivibrio sulfidiphilus TaxID=1033854 RepID=UPI00039C8362|nr:S8 family peptidase [Thioalkalivibrio sulfidiphilus]
MKQARKTLGIFALALICLAVSTVHATPTDRIIIKVSEPMRPAVLADGAPAPRARERVSALSVAVGHEVVYLRAMSGGADVVRLPRAMPLEQVQAMAEAMARLPGVEYAEPDARVFPALEPNDPLYDDPNPNALRQWYLDSLNNEPYGINAPVAWAETTGDAVVVAVVDTGIRFTHEDLVGKVLPGYDFVSEDISGEFFTANDGDGRDRNATDPGDWVTEREVSRPDCPVDKAYNSSWHGTHVAGIIGAASNNGIGVAGVSWGAMVLPVRGLGKCGGYVSDIADAIRWAAGVDDQALPPNPYPARIINLSLGGGQCTQEERGRTWQRAIDDALELDVLVVAAAGNSGSNLDTSPMAPASCNGVLTVAATDRNGQRAVFNLQQSSNYGSAVDVAAPGISILSTIDSGTKYPSADAYAFYSGTSMAAPIVSGVAALLLSRAPDLTQQQLFELITDTNHVTQFPEGSSCTSVICGSGIVNAALAVASVTDAEGRPGTLFDFAPLEGVGKSQIVTSAEVVVNIAGDPLQISVQGGEYSLEGCDGSFTTADGTVSDGDSLCLRHTASALPDHPAATLVTVGNYRAAFVSMTGPANTDPDPLTDFLPKAGVDPAVWVVSEPVTITGIDAPARVSVVGGQYSLGCVTAGYTTEPGYVAPDGDICVRHRSAATGETLTVTTVTVGSQSAELTSTTRAVSSGGGGGVLSFWLFGILFAYTGLCVRRSRRYPPAATPASAP